MGIKEKDKWVEELVAVVIDSTHIARGMVLSYDAIEELVGITRESPKWQAFSKQLRNRLLREFSIACRMRPNEGFELLGDVQQVVLCSKDRQKRIKNQANYAMKEVSAVPADELGEHTRSVQAKQLQFLYQVRLDAKRQIRGKNLYEATETLPTRPRG